MHEVFSHLPGGLEHFADSNSIPYNQPNIFRPSLTATIRQSGRTFVSDTPFRLLRSFDFFTDKIESIEWPNPVPQLRICDCFEIHRPR